MRHARYSIANLLAVIGILGVAMAALRNPSYLWANLTFSVSLAALAVAVLNTIYGQGARRAYWLGFTVVGGAYFAVCWVPGLHESVCPRLVTEVIFDHLYPVVAPPEPPPAQFMATGRMGNQMMGNMLVQMQTQMQQQMGWRNSIGQPGAIVGMGSGVAPAPSTSAVAERWAAWNEPDRSSGVGYRIGTVSLVSSDAFRQIGHSLVTLLVALLGAVYARSRYEARAARDLPQSQAGV
jgi:hypothetical protein